MYRFEDGRWSRSQSVTGSDPAKASWRPCDDFPATTAEAFEKVLCRWDDERSTRMTIHAEGLDCYAERHLLESEQYQKAHYRLRQAPPALTSFFQPKEDRLRKPQGQDIIAEVDSRGALVERLQELLDLLPPAPVKAMAVDF